jgi:SPP1 gp7 family putative phage head morphogenesis protein
MPTPNKKYWIGRFTQMEQAQHKAAVEVADDIERQFKTAQHEVERQLSTWYQRYAVNNQVSMKEARRQLNTKELKEFRWTVNEYIKHGKENGISADWSKQLENASARFHVTRLQAIQLELQNTVEVLYGGQTDALDALMKKTYLDSYYHTAFEIQRGVGVAWDIAAVNQKALVTIINTPWTVDGRNFSERIWANKQALIGELRTQLTQNLMLGKSPAESVKIIAAKMGVAEHKAARLVFTESAYFQAVSQGNCYKALDVRKFQFIATLDDRTSDVCREMDGQVFDMRDYQPGVNVPPLHPWCRSCTAPYYEDLAGIGERAARDPETGQTYYIPRETKYEDWKQSFVDGGSKQGLTPTSGSDILKGVRACTTVGEVEKWLRGQGWFRVGSTDQNQLVSLSGCDLETAQEVALAYERVFDRYPAMKGRIDAVVCKRLDGGTYAQCYTRGGGKVEINSQYFNDHTKLAASYERDVRGGFHPANTDWRSIVVHEIGHAVDGTLTNMGLAGAKSRYSYDYKDVSAELRPKVMKACGLKVADTFNEVSGYATKNNREWFAEAFAELLDSPSPRRVAVELGKQLDEFMKKVKVK